MFRKLMILGLVSIFAVAIVGCETDMEIINNNEPDTQKVLASPDDIESLLGGTFLEMWRTWMGSWSPAPSFGVASYVNSSSWGNWGMKMSRAEPPIPYPNAAAAYEAPLAERAWFGSYRALSSIAEVLRQMDGGLQLGVAGADDNRARAFGKLVQGIVTANLAMTYDKGFIYDENFDVASGIPAFVPYMELYAQSIVYLKEAVTLSGAVYSIPSSWINGVTATNEDVKMWANQYIAMTMAGIPRNAADRNAVSWSEVKAFAEKGVRNATDDLIPEGDGTWNFWWDVGKDMPGWAGWAKAAPKLVGGYEEYDEAIADLPLRIAANDAKIAADPEDKTINSWLTGKKAANAADYTFKAWLATPPGDRVNHDIYTSDRRVTGVDADGNNDPTVDGKYIKYGNGQFHPESRGTYTWSNYQWTKYFYMDAAATGPMPFLTKLGADFLIAEAMLRTGDKDGAVAIINATRVGMGEMAPVTAAMTDKELFNAFMYEKRMEVGFDTSIISFTDIRGWTDKDEDFIQWPVGKWTHLPVPAKELEILLEEGYTFGGGTDPSDSKKMTLDYVNKLKARFIASTEKFDKNTVKR